MALSKAQYLRSINIVFNDAGAVEFATAQRVVSVAEDGVVLATVPRQEVHFTAPPAAVTAIRNAVQDAVQAMALQAAPK